MLVERDLAHVLIYDREPDKAAYLASDLAETIFSGGYNNRVSAVETMDALRACDVILIAAGDRRVSGSDTETLFGRNRLVMDEVARTFTGCSTLFVLASEPVDLLTTYLVGRMRLPFSRVLGLGGVLDAHRVRHLLGEKMRFNPDSIRNQVVGPHDHSVLPLWDFTSINGVPVRSIVDDAMLVEIADELSREDTTEATEKSSSRYAPGAACLDIMSSIILDDRRILSTTVNWENVLGVSGVAMGIPCVIGRLGAERIVVPELRKRDMQAFTDTAASYAGILKGART